MSHLLSLTEPRFLITEAGLLTNVLPAVETFVPAARILVLDIESQECSHGGFESWRNLLRHGEHDWIRINDETTAKTTIAALQPTSGTSGLPKVATTSHHALVAAGVAMRCLDQKPYKVSRLISLSLFHSFGTSFVQLSAFHYGKSIYIMRRFNAEAYVHVLDKLIITETAVVPAMMASIIDQRITRDVLKGLRRIWCAGSLLSSRLSKAMYELLHEDAMIFQVWGMTEFGRITSSEWLEKDDNGSVGKLLPNTEARYVVSCSEVNSATNDFLEWWTSKASKFLTRASKARSRSADRR